jgi:DNA-binding transcriptional MerR regulator
MSVMPTRAPDLLRTHEVLERTGISHQVLYRYVTLGLIEPATTTDKGLRYFRPTVVQLIEIIKDMTEGGGYSLRDLKDIFFKDERVKKLTERAGSKA